MTYQQQIINLFGASLKGYWPLNEASGATAFDLSGNGYNGTYTDVTLAQPGIGDGNTSAQFGLSTSQVDLYSTGFRDAITPKEFTMGIWIKMTAAQWAATNQDTFMIGRSTTGAQEYFALLKNNGGNRLDGEYSPTSTKTLATTFTSSGWNQFVMTISDTNDRMRVYINGVQQGVDLTGIGTWGVPKIGKMLIGQWTSAGYGMLGYAAHAFFANGEATPEVVASSFFRG